MAVHLLISILISFLATISYASDPSPVQDFCVADYQSSVFVNGRTCKNPNTVTADDFFLSGQNNPVPNPAPGVRVIPLTVGQIPGLNTLGVAAFVSEIAPGNISAPHIHPRGSEIIFVSQGTLYVGFIATNPTDPALKPKLFAKTLLAGDAFVFPEGLVHFILNNGTTNAVVFSALGSQNPGFFAIANAVFGSDPPINSDILTKAFRTDSNTIANIQSQFA